MRLGRALHVSILEPKTFGSRFSVYSERRQGKIWDEFKAKHLGTEILTLSQALSVSAMSMAARKHPEVTKLLKGGHSEITCQWSLNGRQLKSRIDYLTPKALLDIKTCRDASSEAFNRSAFSQGYIGQMAFYSDAVKACSGKEVPVFLIALESTAPFPVSVFEVSRDLLEFGRETYVDLLATLTECERTDSWPEYFKGVAQLQVPRWAQLFKDVEEDVDDWGISFNGSNSKE